MSRASKGMFSAWAKKTVGNWHRKETNKKVGLIDWMGNYAPRINLHWRTEPRNTEGFIYERKVKKQYKREAIRERKANRLHGHMVRIARIKAKRWGRRMAC